VHREIGKQMKPIFYAPKKKKKKKKKYGVTKVQLHVFLTTILHGISGQLQAAAALTRHVLNRRLGAPRSHSGRFGKQKNVSHPYKK
jgi:hypothetical protein